MRAPTPSVSSSLHTAPDYHLLLQLRDPGNFTRKPPVWLTETALSFRQVWRGYGLFERAGLAGRDAWGSDGPPPPVAAGARTSPLALLGPLEVLEVAPPDSASHLELSFLSVSLA